MLSVILVPGDKFYECLERPTILGSHVHPRRTSGSTDPSVPSELLWGGYRWGIYEVSADSIYATKPMLPAET